MLLASVLRDGGLLTYKEDKIEHEAGKQPDGSGRLYSGDFTPVGAGGKAVSYPSLYSSRTYSHSCCFGRRMAGSGFPWGRDGIGGTGWYSDLSDFGTGPGNPYGPVSGSAKRHIPSFGRYSDRTHDRTCPDFDHLHGLWSRPEDSYRGFDVLFPVAVSFSDGLSRVDEEYVHLVRSYGAGKWGAYRLVKIPAALPALLSGLKVAATYSISGAVVGEWIGSQQGLGYYLLRVKTDICWTRFCLCSCDHWSQPVREWGCAPAWADLPSL